MKYVSAIIIIFIVYSSVQADDLYDNKNDNYIHVKEVDRDNNVSKVEVTLIERKSTAVGDTMFLVCELLTIGKRRGYDYMLKLNEEKLNNNKHLMIIGYTNNPSVDVKIEWSDYWLENVDYYVVPVSKCDELFQNKT